MGRIAVENDGEHSKKAYVVRDSGEGGDDDVKLLHRPALLETLGLDAQGCQPSEEFSFQAEVEVAHCKCEYGNDRKTKEGTLPCPPEEEQRIVSNTWKLPSLPGSGYQKGTFKPKDPCSIYYVGGYSSWHGTYKYPCTDDPKVVGQCKRKPWCRVS